MFLGTAVFITGNITTAACSKYAGFSFQWPTETLLAAPSVTAGVSVCRHPVLTPATSTYGTF